MDSRLFFDSRIPCVVCLLDRKSKRFDLSVRHFWLRGGDDLRWLVRRWINRMGQSQMITMDYSRASRENTHTVQRMRMEKSNEKVA